METELEIAKENIICFKDKLTIVWSNLVCQEHKATCERWLFFSQSFINLDKKNLDKHNQELKEKDLRQTIALYKENGI